MESVLIALLHEVDIVLGQVIFANLCLSDRVGVKELPLVLKETLLFSMPCSKRSLRLFPIFIRLERCLPLYVLLVLSQSLLLPV